MLPFIFIKTNGQITPDDIRIELDDRTVEFSLNQNGIFIYADCVFGLHKLCLTSINPVKLEILQVFINDCSLRKMLYLGWIENSSHEKFQPGTVIWEVGQTWHLPFGYPVSYWLELVETKFPNGELGKDLYEQYWIYYPDRLIVDSTQFPKIITDFFLHNFNFTVIPKEKATVEKIPYMWYKKSIPQNLLELAGQEVVENINNSTTLSYIQRSENQEEFGDDFDSNWNVTWLYKRGKKLPIANDYPCVQSIIDLLELDCWTVFIGKLPPGDFIYPHVDDTYNSDPEYINCLGCTQLYIPLIWPQGNFIKFAGVGILPLAHDLLVINTDNFTHSVVNTSDQPRYALGIRANNKIINDCFIR